MILKEKLKDLQELKTLGKLKEMVEKMHSRKAEDWKVVVRTLGDPMGMGTTLPDTCATKNGCSVWYCWTVAPTTGQSNSHSYCRWLPSCVVLVMMSAVCA